MTHRGPRAGRRRVAAQVLLAAALVLASPLGAAGAAEAGPTAAEAPTAAGGRGPARPGPAQVRPAESRPWAEVREALPLLPRQVPAPPQPPPPDPALLRDLDPTPRPLPGVARRAGCVRPTAVGGSAGQVVADAPWSQQRLRFTDAWRFTRGAGQTVAVIDTGVAPHPRLAGRLVDGGDFVATDGGLADCDGHGTLVAGIVAAAPDPRTGFVGVAPEARVLSIRQSSATVATPRGPGGGTVDTLAAAIVRAVALGADVVNISEAACLPAADAPRLLAPLRAAVSYAVSSDVVVVAAAGNAGSGACAQTPDGEVAGQVVAPAWFGDDVLSVGYTRRDGLPAPQSIRAPWVSLSAPGSEIVSLSPTGAGVVDQVVPIGAGAAVGIEGTSFAAPYVSGVVALVRARYPGLTARQVMERVVATATHPAGPSGRDDAVGAGTVDPVAAVADVRPAEFGAAGAATAPGGGPSAGRVDLRAAGDAHSGARTVALVGSAVALLVGVLAGTVGAVLVARRARRPR